MLNISYMPASYKITHRITIVAREIYVCNYREKDEV
jgi:hypothetical protein